MVKEDVRNPGVTLSANGYSVTTIPFSYFASVDQSRVRPDYSDLHADGGSYTVGLGAKPSHELGLFLFANNTLLDGTTTALGQGLSDTTLKLDNKRADIGLNYKFSPTSQLWLKVGTGKEQSRFGGNFYSPSTANAMSEIFGDSFSPTGSIQQYQTVADQGDVQLSLTMDVTPVWQVSSGLESAHQEKQIDVRLNFSPLVTGLNGRDERKSDEIYVINRFRPSNGLLLQADLSYVRLGKRQWSGDFLRIGVATPDLGIQRDDRDITQWNPRLGLAWNPASNQTLRLAAQKWRRPIAVNTLAAVDTAGIAVDDRLVSLGGELKRTRVQYELETGSSTFIQAYADNKRVRNLANISSTLVGDINLEDLDRLRNRNRLSPLAVDLWEASPIFGAAEVNTLSFAVNQLFSNQLSGVLRYQNNSSRNTGTGYEGNTVPWLPRQLFSLGANWVPKSRWQLGVTATHRSQRYSDEANTQSLNAGWNLGLRSYWESADKRWSVEFIAENLHSQKSSAPIHAPVLGAQTAYRF
jgi:hypothetical protein